MALLRRGAASGLAGGLARRFAYRVSDASPLSDDNQAIIAANGESFLAGKKLAPSPGVVLVTAATMRGAAQSSRQARLVHPAHSACVFDRRLHTIKAPSHSRAAFHAINGDVHRETPL